MYFFLPNLSKYLPYILNNHPQLCLLLLENFARINNNLEKLLINGFNSRITNVASNNVNFHLFTSLSELICS